MVILVDLEDSEIAVLTGLDELFEPDGCAFYEARYGRGKKWKPLPRAKRKKQMGISRQSK
jgi:hypothetical protein